MPEYKLLTCEMKDDVAYVTLDAPPLNIMTVAMMDEMIDALEEIHSNRGLKAVAIRGNGKAFSAGADVGEHAPEEAPKLIGSFETLFLSLDALEIPLVVGVHGSALGAGMELAIMGDVLLAEDDAVLGQPEIRLGFFAPVAVARLNALVGPARAAEITCTGKAYGAPEAKAMGLVREVVPAGDLDASLEAVLKDIRRSSPHILRMNMKLLKSLRGRSFAEGFKVANKVFLEDLMETEDAREGLAAFLEKRKPEWKNA